MTTTTIALAAAVLALAAAPAPAEAANTRSLQARLVELGFLPRGSVDGHEGPRTTNAVLAFQKWAGLTRDGSPGPDTRGALIVAERPQPLTHGAGRRVEVLLDRQVALAIEDDRVVRVIPVSTGAPATPTRTGTFRVQSKHQAWWSNPFQIWLPWALPFDGGIALHESDDVPPQPASHGCVRVPEEHARWLYSFLRTGDRVTVSLAGGGLEGQSAGVAADARGARRVGL